MTVTLDAVASSRNKQEPSAEQAAAEELVRRSREQGLSLTGPDGLLNQLTKAVLKTALDQEMTERLGHERNQPAGNETDNVRNGTRAKTMLTEGIGEVGIEVPGTACPRANQRRGAGRVVHRDRRDLPAD